MNEELRRLRVVAQLTQLLAAAIGVVSAAVGIVYLTVAASDLPTWWPGHITHPTSAHHVARGWVMLLIAVVSFVMVGVSRWALAAPDVTSENHDWDELLKQPA